jgi:hypothetical protein
MTAVRNPHQLLLAKQLFEDSRLLAERDDAPSEIIPIIIEGPPPELAFLHFNDSTSTL